MWPFRKKPVDAYRAPEPLSFDFEQLLAVDGKDAYIIPSGYRKASPDEYTNSEFQDVAMVVSFNQRKWLSLLGTDGQMCASALSIIGHPIPYIVPVWWNSHAHRNNPAYIAMVNEHYGPARKTPAMDAWNEWGHNPYDERHLKTPKSAWRDWEGEPAFCECDPKKILRQCKKCYRKYLLNKAEAIKARREGGSKMNIEAGKYYETKSWGIVACKRGPGNSLYLEQVNGTKAAGALLMFSDILREVPPPLKLEDGKKYLMSDDSILVARECEHCRDAILGRFHYDRETRKPGHFSKNCNPPSVVSQVTTKPKLWLEVGALYALSDGSVEWCKRNDCDSPYTFILGEHYCLPNGEMASSFSPKILYKLRVNEPVRAGGEKFQAQVKKVQEMYIATDPAEGSGDKMIVIWKHSSAKACNITDIVSEGPLRFYTECPRCERNAKIAEMMKGASSEPSMTIYNTSINGRDTERPMKVEYKPHTDCEKREIVVPEGFEFLYAGEPHVDGILVLSGDNWIPVDNSAGKVWRNPDMTFIRPITKAFRLSGAGWYKDVGGSWVDLRQELWYNNGQDWATGNYREDGKYRDGAVQKHLIARATDAQAKILDAL